MKKKLEISSEIFEQIFLRHGLEGIRSIKELHGGFANPAFLINEKYVLRTNDDVMHDRRDGFLRESTLYKFFEDLKFPAPRPVAVDITKAAFPFYYIINTYVKGEILSSIYPSLGDDLKVKIAVELGELMKRIHSITENDIRTNTGLFTWMTPWKDKQLARFDQTYFQFNEHKNFLSSENKKTVDVIYKDYVEQISNDDIVFGLIHNDFHANHVVVGKGKVTGIIDFEWASFGDPLWDFQKLSTHLGEGSDAFFVNFLKGYGMETFSKKELIRYKMYCIEQAIWQIDRTKHSDHGFPEEGIRQGYEIIKKINTLNS